MLRLPLAALACLTTLLLAGCSTHEEKFGDATPARVPSAIELRAATDKLLTLGDSSRAQLDPETAAIFTEAASEFATATGAPAARARAARFANLLLLARIGGAGYYGAADPEKVDMPTTLRAGAAMRKAYEATGKERYRDVAAATPGSILAETSGWRSEDGKAFLFNSPNSQRASIAESSLAAGELAAAARELDTGTEAQARAGLRGIADEQVALGRWYSTVGTTRPMSLQQWATTLLGLEAHESKEADGIVAAGLPAMFPNAFTGGGRVVNSDLTKSDPRGVGVAVSALGRSVFTTQASAAQRALLDRARTDGTIDLAPADDLAAQAEYARALAIGLRATVERERKKAADGGQPSER